METVSTQTAATIIACSFLLLWGLLHYAQVKAGKRPRLRQTFGIAVVGFALVILTGWCGGFPGPTE
jgi:multisubunit Na+/H+ antiporter MnhB subunit